MNNAKAQRKAERRRKLVNRKRRIQYRLRNINWAPQEEPMCTASNIHYELANRVRGLGAGGIGAMHPLGRRIGQVALEGSHTVMHAAELHESC